MRQRRDPCDMEKMDLIMSILGTISLSLLFYGLVYWGGYYKEAALGKLVKGIDYIKETSLDLLRRYIDKVVDEGNEFIKVGKSYAENHIERFVYLGSGPSYSIALEGSLKLKETSYVATEALHALEFRHGPMATIGEKQVVIIINPSGDSYDVVMRLYKEVKDRGGVVLRLSDVDAGEDCLILPRTGIEELTALAAITPLQLLAYGYAVARNRNPDAPRNLVRFVEKF